MPTSDPAATSNGTAAPTPYWAEGAARPFLAARVLAGAGFGRAGLSAGYGKPHWIWAGSDATGTLTPYFGAVQAGIAASAAIVHLGVSLRRTFSFGHGFIPRQSTVRSEDLEQKGSPRAHYTTLDANLWGFVPCGRLLVGWELSYVRPLLNTDDLTYDEVQRAVMTADGLVTSKLTPMLRVLPGSNAYAGVLVEHLTLLTRSEPLVLRLGPSIWLKLTDHMDFALYLSWPVVGRDRLGIWDGMYGTLGVLYRFATKEPRRQFP